MFSAMMMPPCNPYAKKNHLDDIELHDVAVEVEQACLEKMAPLEAQKHIKNTKSKVVGLGERHLVWERCQ
jgi:hypothetical protein